MYRHNKKKRNFSSSTVTSTKKTQSDTIYKLNTLNGLDEKTTTTTNITVQQLKNQSKITEMAAEVNYVLIPSEENITPGDPKGLKIYLRATKEVEKEADKLDI